MWLHTQIVSVVEVRLCKRQTCQGRKRSKQPNTHDDHQSLLPLGRHVEVLDDQVGQEGGREVRRQGEGRDDEGDGYLGGAGEAVGVFGYVPCARDGLAVREDENIDDGGGDNAGDYHGPEELAVPRDEGDAQQRQADAAFDEGKVAQVEDLPEKDCLCKRVSKRYQFDAPQVRAAPAV